MDRIKALAQRAYRGISVMPKIDWFAVGLSTLGSEEFVGWSRWDSKSEEQQGSGDYLGMGSVDHRLVRGADSAVIAWWLDWDTGRWPVAALPALARREWASCTRTAGHDLR